MLPKIEYKVLPLSRWELCQEEYERQGWQSYGYGPDINHPAVVELRREVPRE